MVTSSPRASAASTIAGPTKSVPPRTRTLRDIRDVLGGRLLGPAQEQRGNHTENREDRDEGEGAIERGAERVCRVVTAEGRDHRSNVCRRRRLAPVLDQRRELTLESMAELRGRQLVPGR